MHEFGVMQGVIQTALGKAHEAGASHIHVIRLRVGQLSGIIPEAMMFAHDVVCEETIAAGSRLEIVEVPATCYCDKCDKSFQPTKIVYRCPDCDSISSKILTGKELELINMEIS